MSKHHRLAKAASIKAADLAGETFIALQVSTSMGLSASLFELMRAGGLSPPTITGTGDFVTAANLAAAGFGIVVAPQSLSNLGLGGILFREIDDYSGTVDLALAWAACPSRRISPAAERGNSINEARQRGNH